MIVVDRWNTVVSGNHRYQAMLDEFGQDYEITVYQRLFFTEKTILKFFAEENVKHGNPLDGISKKRIAASMLDAGATEKEIAKIFNIPVKRVIGWGEDCVMLVIGKNKTTPVPVKNGPDIEPGQTITQKEYTEHIKYDIGKSPFAIAEQLSRWLRNGWVKKTDANVECMNELVIGIDGWFTDMKKDDGKE